MMGLLKYSNRLKNYSLSFRSYLCVLPVFAIPFCAFTCICYPDCDFTYIRNLIYVFTYCISTTPVVFLAFLVVTILYVFVIIIFLPDHGLVDRVALYKVPCTFFSQSRLFAKVLYGRADRGEEID